MRIALMVPDLNVHGDAVGNDVIGMHDVLTVRGFAARIHVRKTREVGASPIWSYEEIKLGRGDCVIYHYATADDAGMQILRATPATVILRYHNVTPPHYFEGRSADYANATRAGRAAVRALAALPRLTLMPASRFSADELSQEGLHSNAVHIVPPFHRAEELFASPDAATATPHNCSGLRLLSVGRIAPHKRVDRLIECVTAIRRKTGVAMSLTVVGSVDPRLQTYWREIENLIRALDMQDHVRFLHHAPQAVLARCYREADLVVTASEHEGFWVPGVEAMAFGKPIVALKRTAVPETCAEAAILCDTMEAMEKAIERLLGDPSARAQLGRDARLRYEREFAPGVIEGRFIAALQPSVRSWRTRLRGMFCRGGPANA
jgi:glycosyltransferase involved in cell wall biosynthesis